MDSQGVGFELLWSSLRAGLGLAADQARMCFELASPRGESRGGGRAEQHPCLYSSSLYLTDQTPLVI